MSRFLRILLIFIALQHVTFLILEMFLWTHPLGQQIFRTSPEYAQASARLAANQGLYNGFLAAGLLWSFFASADSERFLRARFFLICIFAAGVLGGLTVSSQIFAVQALPALLALALLSRSRV